jgi:hypothetical protein
VARASTTSDVFNAVADTHRREILDALITGEKAVGAGRRDVVACTAWNPRGFGRCTTAKSYNDWESGSDT